MAIKEGHEECRRCPDCQRTWCPDCDTEGKTCMCTIEDKELNALLDKAIKSPTVKGPKSRKRR